MLSKEEIIKKKGGSSQQLDLVETVDEADKIRKKRIIIGLFLLLTVGLSLVFSLYREFTQNGLRFSWPSLSFSLPTITPPLSVDPNFQVVCLVDSKTSTILFSKDCPSPPTLSGLSTSTLLLQLLPSGLDIKEKITKSSGITEFSATIVSPRRELSFYIKTSLPDSSIATLVESLYWKYASP